MQTAAHATATPPTPVTHPGGASFSRPGLIALEGGAVETGMLHGAATDAEGDLIFTTAATGWGEILTDPSYAGQIVVLTHPMAGSYRIDRAELESDRVHARALIVSRLVTPPYGPGIALDELAREAGIPIMAGIDTRALTLHLRRGAQRRAVVRTADTDAQRAIADARESVAWEAVDHVAQVSCRAPRLEAAAGRRRGRAVVVDYGVKRSLLAAITARGLDVVVLPHHADAAQVASAAPDLVVLSPGPGDPARMTSHIAVVGELAARAIAGGPPVLGVCLGHQLLALAAGASTRRLAVGHHGGNHAVLELATGRVDIGAHNHEVEVRDGPELGASGYAVSHRDLNDGTVEGLVHRSGRVASVQFHPEGAPGPIDASRAFDIAVVQAVGR